MEEVLQALFIERFGMAPETITRLPLSGSHRSYYRLGGAKGASVIGAIGTDADENRAFLTLSRHFRSKGLPVPEILAVSPDRMAYIQEDLGTESLYDAVAAGRASGDYSPSERSLLLKAVRLLPRVQFEGADGIDWSVCYPQREFDARMVDFDLNYFKYDFLKFTGVEFNEVRLQDDFDRIKTDLLAVRSETFLYRDFQARNIMLRAGEPYLIDYQGGRKGPFYYDLASFAWQARAQYPEDLREEMVAAYRDALRPYADVPEAQFRRELRLFVLFRTLQVLGAYGYRGLYERKPYFLESIPLAINNLRNLIEDHPDLLAELPELNKVLRRVRSAESGERSYRGCGRQLRTPNSELRTALGLQRHQRGVARPLPIAARSRPSLPRHRRIHQAEPRGPPHRLVSAHARPLARRGQARNPRPRQHLILTAN